jgi:hypothetical protein
VRWWHSSLKFLEGGIKQSLIQLNHKRWVELTYLIWQNKIWLNWESQHCFKESRCSERYVNIEMIHSQHMENSRLEYSIQVLLSFKRSYWRWATMRQKLNIFSSKHSRSLQNQNVIYLIIVLQKLRRTQK